MAPISGTNFSANTNNVNFAKQPVVRDLAREVEEKRNKNSNLSSVKKAEDLYDKLGFGMPKDPIAPPKNNASEIGDFMKLFLAQLKCQDPLNPTEGAEFVAQLAQFNSVEQLQKVNTNINTMTDSFRSSQILGATSMIGKEIKIPTNTLQLSSYVDGEVLKAEVVKGTIKMPDLKGNEKITDFRVKVLNDKKEVIQGGQIKIPPRGKDYDFIWDGTDDDGYRLLDHTGKRIKDGEYKISAKVFIVDNDGGRWKKVEPVVSTRVTSVHVAEDGEIEFSAAGIGKLKLEELREIAAPEFATVKAPEQTAADKAKSEDVVDQEAKTPTSDNAEQTAVAEAGANTDQGTEKTEG